jgi:hypothetical protein
MLVRMTVALEITDPVGSDTVPRMSPVESCADAGAANTHIRPKKVAMKTAHLFAALLNLLQKPL